METRSTRGRVHRLTFDVEWPPGHVACYVVDSPEPILVDAATPDHEAAFVDAVDSCGHDVTGDVAGRPLHVERQSVNAALRAASLHRPEGREAYL